MLLPSGTDQGRRKGGAVVGATAPLQSGQSYFFLAFFLAAFLAFFAIVPPEGVWLVPDGDCGCARTEHRLVSELHKPLSEPSTLIPDVDYG
jgi:hypothetical protein